MAAEIAYEATLSSNNTDIGRPLPLASSWMTGANATDLEWLIPAQLQRIAEGNYILPTIQNSSNSSKFTTTDMQSLATLGLPFSVRVNNIITIFQQDPFRDGMLIKDDGTVSNYMISVFGPLSVWEAAGKYYASTWWKTFASIYPNPPAVIIVDNNEQTVLSPENMAQDIRYDGPVDYNLWLDNFATRRLTLQNAWRNALPAAWGKAMKFVGYGESASGPHGGTAEFDSYRYFDGGSWSYYLNDWQVYGNNDFHIWSPQLDSMNVYWGMKAYATHYSNFWLENSIWGDPLAIGNYYQTKWGQQFTPARYGGWVGFGMWMTRPRVVRDFYSSTQSYAPQRDYIYELYRQVNSVHNNETLKQFWRKGELLESTLQDHPSIFSSNTNYLLECDANYNITANSDDYQVVNVFGLALKLGNNVLLYAHAPQGNYSKVTFKIPGYGDYYVPTVEQRGTTAVFSLTAPRITFSADNIPITHRSGPVNFGSLTVGSASPSKTIVMKNIGVESLVISNISIPAGWTMVKAPKAVLAQNESDTLIIQLSSTAQQGILSGNIVVSSNDDNEGIFEIPLKASIYPYTYRMAEIKIHPDKVGAGGVSNFTVLLTEASLPPEIFALAKSDAGDVRVYTDTSLARALTVDVILWDKINGKAVLRVGPTSLSDTATTSLWITYGKSDLLRQDGHGAYDANWIAYWPMEEKPSTTSYTILNRISNNYHGIVITDLATPIQSSGGRVGSSLELFTGKSTDRIYLSSSLSLPDSWTMIAWGMGNEGYKSLWGKRSDNGPLLTNEEGSSVALRDDGYDQRIKLDRGITLNDGKWHQLAVRRNPITMQAASDGNWGTAVSGSLNNGFDVDSLGAGRYESWVGRLDEFQFHAVNRSDAWIATEYNQTSNPAAFATAEPPQDVVP